MKANTIRELLLKFYDGQTTLAEEQLLNDYFSQTRNVPDDLIADKIIFENLNAANNIEIPTNLEGKIAATIDSLSGNKTIELESKQNRKSLIRIRNMAIAACIALLVSIGFFTLQENNHDSDLIANMTLAEEQALVKTYEILNKAEKMLKGGLNPINKAGKTIKTTTRPLKETNIKINKINTTLTNSFKHLKSYDR